MTIWNVSGFLVAAIDDMDSVISITASYEDGDALDEVVAEDVFTSEVERQISNLKLEGHKVNHPVSTFLDAFSGTTSSNQLAHARRYFHHDGSPEVEKAYQAACKLWSQYDQYGDISIQLMKQRSETSLLKPGSYVEITQVSQAAYLALAAAFLASGCSLVTSREKPCARRSRAHMYLVWDQSASGEGIADCVFSSTPIKGAIPPSEVIEALPTLLSKD